MDTSGLTKKDLKDLKDFRLALHLVEGVEAIEVDRATVELLERVISYLDTSDKVYDSIGKIKVKDINDLSSLQMMVGNTILLNFNKLKIRGEPNAGNK